MLETGKSPTDEADEKSLAGSFKNRASLPASLPTNHKSKVLILFAGGRIERNNRIEEAGTGNKPA